MRITRITTTFAVTGMVVAALVAAPTAQASTGVMDYACTVDGEAFAMPVEMSSDAPDTAYFYEGTDLQLTIAATLPADTAKRLVDDHAWSSFSGHVQDAITVHEVADLPGPMMPVYELIPVTSLGTQVTATAVPFEAVSWKFGQVRSRPGVLTFKAWTSLTAVLQVTKDGGDVADLTLSCSRSDGATPVISAIAWIARTTTEVTVPDTEVEFGEPVGVTGAVVPDAGTAVGTLAVTAGGVTATAPVNGTSAPVSLSGVPTGTYQLAAAFTPTDSVYYRSSSAPATTVTVTQASSTTTVRVAGKHASRRALVAVAGEHGTVPNGTAKAVLRRPGHPGSVKRLLASPVGGKATVRLGKLERGRYRVRVVYQGDAGHQRSQVVSTFRVR